MDNITIEMKIKALNNVLKKYNISNEKMDAIKKDFYNELINK
jgi:hypothetical protein